MVDSLKLNALMKASEDALGVESSCRVSEHHRIYAIGDVHGRIDLLRTIIKKIEADSSRFSDDRVLKIVFLGDYIDRGDNSRDVLSFIMDLECSHPGRYVFLRGNHEAALLDFLDDPVGKSAWLEWGGHQTIASFGILPSGTELDAQQLVEIRDALQERISNFVPFLKLLHPYYVSGQVIFAHASLDPNVSLESQPESALLWGRTPKGQSRTLPGYRIVHGHFAGDEPTSSAEHICVDTGAYYSGKLTAVRLDQSAEYIVAKAGELRVL